MTVQIIHHVLRRLARSSAIYIPEFTAKTGRRVDAAIVDLRSRWIRGFEIKMSRSDWLRDEKWFEYSEFTSSLSLVCPKGVIKGEEVFKPFGLLWIGDDESVTWVKKPKRFQRRDGLSWLYTYLKVLEAEMPRLEAENQILRQRIRQIDLERIEALTKEEAA